MNNENWNPGHSINKGYPYNTVLSKHTFKDRPRVWEKNDGKIAIDWDKKAFANHVVKTEQDLKDFMLHRLIDFQEALRTCEEQIEDILTESPFVPENNGFELVVQNQKVDEAPMSIYVSTLSPNFSLFRKPGIPGDDNWQPSLWTLLQKTEKDGTITFKENDLNLPCARIAYAVLFAFGVKQPEWNGEDTVKELDEIKQMAEEKGEKIVVTFERDGLVKTMKFDPKEFKNDKEALTKAKFLLETDHEVFFNDFLFEELSISKYKDGKLVDPSLIAIP